MPKTLSIVSEAFDMGFDAGMLYAIKQRMNSELKRACNERSAPETADTKTGGTGSSDGDSDVSINRNAAFVAYIMAKAMSEGKDKDCECKACAPK